jgi:putative hydrolase of the HAD superfamily
MLRAVLFDWTNTLVQFTWDDDLFAAGHEAALSAIGRPDDPAEFTERCRPLVLDSSKRPYPELLRVLLGDLSDADVDRFIDVEHDLWRSAHQVLAAAPALLESLRSRGLRTGLVANSWPDPARLLRRDIADAGLSDLLDVLVFSEEVGAFKPEPAIFRRALEQLEVDAIDAMFVGDRLDTDVQGAANVGMTTVQALWFNADDSHPEVSPDFTAFTPMDVLNAVRRVAR